MAKDLDQAASTDWQDLMAEWAATTAEYEAASKAGTAQAEAIRLHLENLKEKIASHVRRAALERDKTGDTFTEATIVPGAVETRRKRV
jgi:hypothetical protein